jgi:hypothetical protein
MAEPSEIGARVSALEVRVGQVAADASAARHLAAARDADVADLAVKVDAHRSAINALGLQTAARFDGVEHDVRDLRQHVDDGFTQVRGKLDELAAGQEHVVRLLTSLIDQPGDSD